ncbi:D-isomer specific 2-hydroxyacid dehydrogenase family protein [Corynebacterium terpenotabidum]|uniref:D-isomer specific 2-hydroxyacid dehydrogenase NAD-binding domain-containing protein n=1 Tax=Corynebacterium terpenotabidum Y-11 TaxID=1200352 RepID=S4XD81_9CORY|nr:D-isomer specific 2-hydroxyacid dehydrogenase family protein [Corynebacterium terpenotabidum]AGP30464.1 hypothetical protein A606_04075 [Corynebacterium terpenotabidum Y-11]
MTDRPLRIHIAARPLPLTAAALEDAGAVIVDDIADADAFLCVAMRPDAFPELPDTVRWVQLCQAGIEGFLEAGVVTAGPGGIRRWSNASGIYGRQVAEAAVGLLLSVTHMHVRIARAKSWSVWREVDAGTRWLAGSTVVIVGAGGIGRHLIDMLTPFGVEFVAVNHSGRPVDGARQTVPFTRLDEALPQADHLVLSAPLTDETRGLIDADALARCRRGVTVVNVARGPVVVTDDLVAALESGHVAGAGLDVTDPEPLPDGHPLWDMDNVTVTTHAANTVSSMDAQLAAPTVENYRRLLAGERMLTELDTGSAY